MCGGVAESNGQLACCRGDAIPPAWPPLGLDGVRERGAQGKGGRGGRAHEVREGDTAEVPVQPCRAPFLARPSPQHPRPRTPDPGPGPGPHWDRGWRSAPSPTPSLAAAVECPALASHFHTPYFPPSRVWASNAAQTLWDLLTRLLGNQEARPSPKPTGAERALGEVRGQNRRPSALRSSARCPAPGPPGCQGPRGR